ncbi:MAG TPA: LysM peptidoglycan-binding domain-containing protein [Actinomycetes bacterium]|nr:LysM peptidoglycan-binding domain-containing protein [Actinomycetes bacterium]
MVEPGDTLWSIARRVAPGRDPRPVVDGLIDANHLRGGLQVGQELSIPVPER